MLMEAARRAVRRDGALRPASLMRGWLPDVTAAIWRRAARMLIRWLKSVEVERLTDVRPADEGDDWMREEADKT